MTNERALFESLVRNFHQCPVELVDSIVEGKVVFKLKINDVDVVKWCPRQDEVRLTRNVIRLTESEALINAASEAIRNYKGLVKGFEFGEHNGLPVVETWSGRKPYRAGMYIDFVSGKTRMVGE